MDPSSSIRIFVPLNVLLFLLLLLLLRPRWTAAVVEDGLLNNGDFEMAPTGGFPSAATTGEGATSLPGWTVNGTVELVESSQKQGGMILIVPEGVHAVRLGNDAEIAQGMQLEKGSLYCWRWPRIL